MVAPDAQTCPHCKRRAQMTYVAESARLVDEKIQRVEAAYQCYVCGRFVIGGATHVGLQRGFHPDESWVQIRIIHRESTPRELFDALDGLEEYWEPVSPVGKTFVDVPDEISGPADEAYKCLSIGAHRAAVLMARAVIEATAKTHKITKGRLVDKIDEMGANGVIRPLLVDAAHEIRHIGNDMAHGDFATAKLTEEDAVETLELMDDVLTEGFVLPRRVERRRDRRADPPSPTKNPSASADPAFSAQRPVPNLGDTLDS